MDTKPFIIMTALQAARFVEETAADENRLEPREIEGGTHAGKYALPERVMFDDAFEQHRDAFRMLTVAAFDVNEAFPPAPEE